MNTQGKAVKKEQRPMAGSMPGTSERQQVTERTEEESGGEELQGSWSPNRGGPHGPSKTQDSVLR